MIEFAKIFNTKDYGQILVTNDSRDDVPSVNFFFNINANFGLCELRMKMKDTDSGWASADKVFNEVTENKAVLVVKETVDAMR